MKFLQRHSMAAPDEQSEFGKSHARSPRMVLESTFRFLRPLKPTVVFATYWKFAVERQEVFFRRLFGDEEPWSSDPVLQQYKFTNAYRAADRVSQFLIRSVIYKGSADPRDTFFRIILFKFFNRIDTWELLMKHFGEVSLSSYSFEAYNEVMTGALAAGRRLYSAAYIMPSGGPNSPYARKHQMHLRLLEQMTQDELAMRIVECSSMSKAFALLRAYPTIGDFLAYQYVTDLNYSNLTDFNEMEFVVPGPGALDGIRKCFTDLGGLSEAEVIKFIAERQDECLAALGLRFPTLWGRRLQLIDCQNLFCEVDKYARIVHPEFSGRTGRTRIKQKLQPSANKLELWFPPKWGINGFLHKPPEYVPHS
jgi:hypothetical protein